MKLNDLKEIIREVVREEVRDVLREELSSLKPQQPLTQVTETKKIPSSLQTLLNSAKAKKQQPAPQKMFNSGNPLDELLNETAAGSEWRTLNYGAQDAQSFIGQQTRQQIASSYGAQNEPTSVEGFFQQNKSASDINQVRIDTVPDFSGMMDTLKKKGKL